MRVVSCQAYIPTDSCNVNHVSGTITEFLIRQRWPLLAISVLLTVAAIWPAGRLDFDRSIENMFAQDDPLLVSYRKLQRTFGGNEIVLAVYTDEALFATDGSGIDRVSQIRERLERVPGVKSVLSIDRPLGKAIVEPDSNLAKRIRDVFEGYTHGRDGKTVSLACMLAPRGETDVPRQETVDALRTIMRGRLPAPLSPGMVAGEPVMVVDGFRFVEQDGRRLGWASTILLGLVILLCFRSLRWVLIPILVVQLTLLWTKALLAVSGLQLSMVSSMLTAVVTVVGIATVVHIIVRYREARIDGLLPPDALMRAGTILCLPIFWACATDAVGFGSLLVSRVGPVQDFGVMMATGSLLVILAVALVVPALTLLGNRQRRPQRTWGEKLLDVELGRLVRGVQRHPLPVGIAAVVIAAATIAGVGRLQVESDFTKNFREGSDIVRSYQFVEENLGGAGVWDVMLPAPDSLSWPYLRRVHELETRLRSEVVVHDESGEARPGLSKTLSLADGVVASYPNLLNMSDSGFQSLLAGRLVGLSLGGMQAKMPVFYDALYHEDPDEPGKFWLRIMLRSRERQSSANKQQIIAAVERIVREEFSRADESQAPKVTGFFVLLTNLIDSILADQWLAFAIACAGIALMMLVALRNPAHALVALVPNAVPILIVTGLMGWLGVKINMGAAMIAAVSMGLSIDSSIHYITTFQRARRESKSVQAALEASHHSVGRAMVFSTLALIVGFAALCMSQFIPTIYFGALVSLTMLGGLAGNLVVLPLLLRMVTRK